jgi:hypothetical protein
MPLNRGAQNTKPKKKIKMLKSTPPCPKLTLEVLKVNIFRFKNAKGPDLNLQSNGKKVVCTAEKKAQNWSLGNYRVCPNLGN